MPCVFLSQRDTAAEQPKLHGVAANRGTRVFDFGTLNQSQHHQALHLRIDRVNEVDDALLAAFQGRERSSLIPITSYKYWLFRPFGDYGTNDNDSHFDKQ